MVAQLLTLLLCHNVRMRSALHSAFTKHTVDAKRHTLDHRTLRKTFSDLGADISEQSSRRLLHAYANESATGLTEFCNMIEQSTVASPIRYFWLPLDPEGNGARKRRKKWNNFGRAGLVTPVRIAHYGTGLASIAIGAIDYGDFVFHAGVSSLDFDAAAYHAFIHMSTAVFSLPRFAYKWTNDKWWYLWMEDARVASMWPSAALTLWYFVILKSDFVLPAADATFAFNSPLVRGLSLINSLTLVYSACRTIEEEDESGVYERKLSNVLLVLFTMTIPILADTGKCLLLSRQDTYAEYLDIVDRHPVFSHIYIGSLLGAMFQGSLVCALSSAQHHKALAKEDIGNLSNMLAVVASVASLYAIFNVDHGQLAREMIDVTLKAL